MGLERKYLLDSFRGRSDDELLAIVFTDIHDLTPDAIDALKEVLSERGKRSALDLMLNIQENGITNETFMEHIEMIRSLPCPKCSNEDSLLNAIAFNDHGSIEFSFGCPGCLVKELEKEGTLHLVGFTSITGIIKGVVNMSSYGDAMSKIKQKNPSEALVAFIEKRGVEIEFYKDDRKKLEAMIMHPDAIEY